MLPVLFEAVPFHYVTLFKGCPLWMQYYIRCFKIFIWYIIIQITYLIYYMPLVMGFQIRCEITNIYSPTFKYWLTLQVSHSSIHTLNRLNISFNDSSPKVLKTKTFLLTVVLHTNMFYSKVILHSIK